MIAETVQTVGAQNGQFDEQFHATGATGSGAPLSDPDPIGWGMPSLGSEGPEALPDARREKARGRLGVIGTHGSMGREPLK